MPYIGQYSGLLYVLWTFLQHHKPGGLSFYPAAGGIHKIKRLRAGYSSKSSIRKGEGDKVRIV